MCVFVWKLQHVCDYKADGVKTRAVKRRVLREREANWDDTRGTVGDLTTVIQTP